MIRAWLTGRTASGAVRTDANSGGGSPRMKGIAELSARVDPMDRRWPALVVCVAVLATAASGIAGPVWGVAGADDADGVGGGTHVSAAVGAEGVHLDGVARRGAFERELSRAGGPDETAAVIARQLAESQAHLQKLERRHETLQAARDNGSLSRTTYEVRLARLAAAAGTVERMAVGLERAAADLSDERLRDAGASRAAIEELGADAETLRERTSAGVASRGSATFYADAARLTERYNEAVGSGASDRIQRQLRAEVVVMRAESGDQPLSVSFRIDENGRITELRPGERADATLLMRTDAETVRRLSRADEPVDAFRRAVASDDVRLSGIGPVNWIKWAVVDLVA